MTYDVYAMWPEGAYLVASSNHREHGANMAERVCKSMGHWPMGFATLTRGEHVLNCDVFNLEDLKRKEREHGN